MRAMSVPAKYVCIVTNVWRRLRDYDHRARINPQVRCGFRILNQIRKQYRSILSNL